MRRTLLLLGTALLLWFTGRWLHYRLASDEQKIRWQVEEMLEGYNTAQPGMAVGPLDPDWRHEGHGELDRELLRGALFRVAMNDRDRETRELTSRVALVEDSLVIEVAGDTAALEFEAVFSRRKRGDEEWTERWRLRIEAELEDGDDGWKIVRSRHEDLAGTQLSR